MLKSLALHLPAVSHGHGPSNANVISHIPLKLRSLRLAAWDVHRPDSGVHEALERSADSLTNLSLIEILSWSTVLGASPARGTLDAVLPKLTNLASLELGTCALSDLGAGLSGLARLRDVRLVCDLVWKDFRAEEVKELLTNSSSLRTLGVPERTWSQWSATDRLAIEAAAALKSIMLEQIEF